MFDNMFCKSCFQNSPFMIIGCPYPVIIILIILLQLFLSILLYFDIICYCFYYSFFFFFFILLLLLLFYSYLITPVCTTFYLMSYFSPSVTFILPLFPILLIIIKYTYSLYQIILSKYEKGCRHG